MDYNYIQHHGVKGQRWGVRRYQNKDGSLTDAGKKRRNAEYDGLSKKQKDKYKADPQKWARDDNANAKRVVEESSHMTNKLKQINDKSMRNRPKATMDLSNMTDEQMRREINRKLLEKQYTDMFAPQKQAKGREFASKFLDVGTDVLAVTGSALGIALAVQQLRNPKGGGN